ncbi:MAG: DNA adenine methylase [Dethiobacter sp.]|nr:DNA adenine methylase [Dethiobacter sp.]
MEYDNIFILRYMGNKNRLLNFVVPAIEEVTGEGDTVCDPMAGTHCICYALKNRNKIIANDIQQYSYIIGRALIENNTETISKDEAEEELTGFYLKNQKENRFRFFYENYTDTYFAKEQCLAIDSIRYAIDMVGDKYKQALYLCALMHAMCKVQSTPGHFAQFMPKEHQRILPLRAMDVWEEFLNKCDDFRKIVNNGMENKVYRTDYKELLSNMDDSVSCYYIDPPYSGEQYSRFYHVLETVVKYDNPKLKHKALYRNDRFKSGFCYKRSVESEFELIMKEVSERQSSLVISYSEKGTLPLEKLKKLSSRYFKHVDFRQNSHTHSTLGKGSNNIKEILLILN